MQKRSLILSTGLVSLISLTFASVFIFNQGQTKAVGYLNPGKMTTQQRIENAKMDEQQMKQTPEEESTVLVSFNGLQKKDVVRDMVTNRNLKVNRMYHAFIANKTHTGGYLLKDRETIEAALATYEKDLQEGIKTQIQIMQKNAQELEKKVSQGVTNEKALEDQKALATLKIAIEDLQQQSVYLQTNGLDIYGLQITGKNKDILELRENASVIAIDKVTLEKSKWNPILQLGGSQ